MKRARAYASIRLQSGWCSPVGLSTEGRHLCSGRRFRAVPLSCGRHAECPCMVRSLVCDVGSGSSAGALVSLISLLLARGTSFASGSLGVSGFWHVRLFASGGSAVSRRQSSQEPGCCAHVNFKTSGRSVIRLGLGAQSMAVGLRPRPRRPLWPGVFEEQEAGHGPDPGCCQRAGRPRTWRRRACRLAGSLPVRRVATMGAPTTRARPSALSSGRQRPGSTRAALAPSSLP
jgi:hypothetical protein